MFENLKKAIIAEAEATKKNNRFYIENGYCSTWAEEHKKPSDEGIKRYCTDRRWEQYQAGEISREKIVALTVARMEKQADKKTAEKLEKLERVAAAPDLESVSISVEWKRSSAWGYNPTATITTHAGKDWKRYAGTASGCGYDKRTAAIGTALNQDRSVLKMLYTVKEKALSEFTPDQIRAAKNYYGTESNRDFIHYGAGYGVLPYFEGGVGMSSFKGVFEACGFKCTAENGTKYTDFYHFERMEV